MPSRNQPVKARARGALNKMKFEIANELGIHNYDTIDKGELTSRQNGYIGGNMVRKMVGLAEEVLANQPQEISQVVHNEIPLERPIH